MVNKELTKEELLKIERNIGKILRIGVFVSTTVIIIGILMFLLSGHSGYAEGVWPDKFNEILSGLDIDDEVINNSLFLYDADAMTNRLYDETSDEEW